MTYGSGKTTQPVSTTHRPRYGLRSLFAASILIAVPFLVLAISKSVIQTEDVIASPVFLVVDVLAVFLFAALGNAVGEKTGTIAGAVVGGIVWMALVFFAVPWSDAFRSQFPLHIATIAMTALALSIAAARGRDGATDNESDQTVRHLLEDQKTRKCNAGGATQGRETPGDSG